MPENPTEAQRVDQQRKQYEEAHKQFVFMCTQVNVDAEKLIASPPPILSTMLKMWFTGQLSDASLMRCIRNLASVNPGWEIVYQGKIESGT